MFFRQGEPMELYQKDHIQLFSRKPLSSNNAAKLMDLFCQPNQEQSGGLAGRVQIKKAKLDHLGPVILKHYYRGGLLRLINKKKFLKGRRYRSQREFECLIKARKKDIPVPEPLAYMVKGGILYETALVMLEIPNTRTLTKVNPLESQKASIMQCLNTHFDKMVKCGIYHVDFHPGNVLIDQDHKLFIVDFDKASDWNGPMLKLRNRMKTRWNRAINKYCLDSWLTLG
ncbi:MAG: hypothetical protein CSA81_09140 [Acidobacteria bacterium]|nr:MAG: hypothetical protein CSA81_09140 [Acidobacteriota bacterium]